MLFVREEENAGVRVLFPVLTCERVALFSRNVSWILCHWIHILPYSKEEYNNNNKIIIIIIIPCYRLPAVGKHLNKGI
jgi:hypothetical protein